MFIKKGFKEKRMGVSRCSKIIISTLSLVFILVILQVKAEQVGSVYIETGKQEKEDSSLSAESVDQLVIFIESALKEDNAQQIAQIKSLNIQLVDDNKLDTIKKCSDLLDKAIKEELSGKMVEANTLFQVCRFLGEMYRETANNNYLSDKVLFFQTLSRENKDKYREAKKFFNQGKKLYREYKYDEAIVLYNKSKSLGMEINYRWGEAICLQGIGDICMNLSKYEQARKRFKVVLDISREIKHSLGEAASLLRLGDVHLMFSEREKAKKFYEAGLRLYQGLEDRWGEAESMGSLGNVYWGLDEYEKAQQFYEVALEIFREIQNQRGEAICLRMLGNIHRVLSEYEMAKQRIEEALEISREKKNRLGEANCFGALGDIHLMLYEYKKARQRYEKALTLHRKINHRRGEAFCLERLGDVFLELFEFGRARHQFEKALAINKVIKNRWSEGNCLISLGDVHRMLLEYEQSRKRYKEGLIIYREINYRHGEGYCLQNLGRLYRKMNDYGKALQYLYESLEIHKKIGYRFGMFISYFITGEIFEANKNFTAAEDNYKKCIQLIEDVWSQIKVEDFKRQYFSTKAFPYDNMISLIFRLGKSKEAFLYAERSKARTFLYLLGNRRIDHKTGTPPELVKEEEELKQKIIVMTIKINKNEEKEKSMRTSTEELKGELLKHKQRHSEIIEKMKLRSPEYASLKTVNPLSIEEIQGLVRQDRGTVLIEYYNTEKATYLWLLDGEKIYAYKIDITEKALNTGIEEFRVLLNEGTSGSRTLASRAGKLYKILLKPVEKHLQEKTRIAVVPHGILHYLPFEAMMNEGKFLVEQGFKFFYLPSASVYKYCREKNPLKKDQLMAIANPDGTLPYSEKEVKEIKKIYRKNAGIFIGNDAKESTIKENVSYPDILHFACHGIFDSDHPMYSCLKLTPDANDDGRLEVSEIFNLKLKPAYLVTLSACDTKLGKMYHGDEIVGMSRAFIYAGTPSIVASLWKVDDYYAAKFMTDFYKALKKNDKIDALDIARKTMIKKYGKRHPYYWAAFVLIGDPR